MDSQLAIDLTRDAVMVSLYVVGPMLIAGLIVGLIIGFIQALTQIQDQTVSFVPKLVAMFVALCFTLPWVVQALTEYTTQLYKSIPTHIRDQQE